MSKILTGLKTQNSPVIVCDKELYELEVPAKRKQEFADLGSGVDKVIVSSASKPASSPLFAKSELVTLDPYRLQ
jgi:hypothetical protein